MTNTSLVNQTDIEHHVNALQHEAQQPLTVAQLSTQLLLSKLETLQAKHPLLSRLAETTQLGKTILTQLKEVTTVFENYKQLLQLQPATPNAPLLILDRSQLAPLQPNKLLVESLNRCLPRFPKTIVHIKNTLPPTCCLLGNEGLLKQVFSNVFINAMEAMDTYFAQNPQLLEAGLEPELQLQLVERNGKTHHSITIEITDQGPGIQPNHLSKLFEPYFSTKQHLKGENQGLGLHLAKQIVEAHDGQIICKSTVGIGTTFLIVLPSVVTSDTV
jgi:signal transduction histidine kinase